MKSSNQDDTLLKNSYAAYGMILDDIENSDIEIPATKVWDDHQMLMNLIENFRVLVYQI